MKKSASDLAVVSTYGVKTDSTLWITKMTTTKITKYLKKENLVIIPKSEESRKIYDANWICCFAFKFDFVYDSSFFYFFSEQFGNFFKTS